MLARLTLTRKGKVILYLAAVLLVAGTASGQQPTVTLPAGPVTVQVPAAFTIEQGDGYLTIRWGKAPNPVDPPPPPPNPVATTQNPLWVLAVVPKGAAPAIENSKTLAGELKGRDADWRVYPPDSPKLAAWAKDLPPVPGLLIIEVKPDGAVKHSTLPLPADEAGVVNAVKAIRGKF